MNNEIIGIAVLSFGVILLILMQWTKLKTKSDKLCNKRFNPPKKRIIKNNKAIGRFTSRIYDDNTFRIGYSLCHKDDVYKSDIARKLAFDKTYDDHLFIPRKIEKEFYKFLEKCNWAYKDKTFGQRITFLPSNK